MAANHTDTDGTSTPRLNPKRVSARKISEKLENIQCENGGEDCFFRTISEVEEKYTPPPMSVFDVSKLRKLCPSEEKVKKPKRKRSCPEDYDPENDAFIHDRLNINFNNDSLKSSIKHFMQTADVPAYKQAISDCFKKKSSGVKRPRICKKKKTLVKPEPEVELDPSDDVGDNPHYGRTPPGALKAMLYARHIVQRIIGKRKYLVPLVNSEVRNTTDTNGRCEPSHALGAPEQSNNIEKSVSGEGIADDKATSSSTSSEISQVSQHRLVESEILKGVVAYVDFICHEDEDISFGIRKELMKLGAEVVPTFTKNDPVSVVLFNDGHISTYKKAKKRGIPLVSVLWIEECRRIGKKAPVSQFPPSKLERYESPEFVKKIKKRKLLYGGERIVPRKQRKRVKKIETPLEDKRPDTVSEYTPQRECPAPEWINNYSSGSGKMKILVNMTGIKEEEFKIMMNEPEDSEKYESSPLPVRLLHKLARGLNSPSEVSSTSCKELTSSTSSTECNSETSKKASDSILMKTNDTSCNEIKDKSKHLENTCIEKVKKAHIIVPKSQIETDNSIKHKNKQKSEGTIETPAGIPTLSKRHRNVQSKILFP